MIHKESVQKGTSAISMEEIQAEIDSVRARTADNHDATDTADNKSAQSLKSVSSAIQIPSILAFR